MAVKTKEEILEAIKSRLEGDTSDEALEFIEDVADTLESFASADKEDWKTKYEENDKEWREKYKNRFFGEKEDDEVIEEDVSTKKLTYDALFEEV